MHITYTRVIGHLFALHNDWADVVTRRLVVGTMCTVAVGPLLKKKNHCHIHVKRKSTTHLRSLISSIGRTRLCRRCSRCRSYRPPCPRPIVAPNCSVPMVSGDLPDRKLSTTYIQGLPLLRSVALTTASHGLQWRMNAYLYEIGGNLVILAHPVNAPQLI